MNVEDIRFDDAGLVPVSIVDARTQRLLTLAYANREAVERTIATKQTHLWSRSRKRLWRKGEESGHTQDVLEVVADCDGDALMYRVIPHGPACHTGADSCFHDTMFADAGHETAGAFALAIEHLERTIASRRGADASQSYVAKLFEGGVDRIGKKIGEEATELVIAAKNKARNEIIWEAADLIFHTLVLLAEEGVSLDEIGGEFQRRAR
ncbi:MAG TPA: bifunctional phosphoribosyl-AMP cyclohydrolase/phosphoribosyl-ATP diphosphatase HisIE [Candidatus Acidoferrales bacterium]|nr:bifunctional phosphoribosyl-AMP cyclohydrolase/phosphoribosyl-ATP diphosphatase HisIE [Candidatus Acidoferrales bacterium]